MHPSKSVLLLLLLFCVYGFRADYFVLFKQLGGSFLGEAVSLSSLSLIFGCLEFFVQESSVRFPPSVLACLLILPSWT